MINPKADLFCYFVEKFERNRSRVPEGSHTFFEQDLHPFSFLIDPDD